MVDTGNILDIQTVYVLCLYSLSGHLAAAVAREQSPLLGALGSLPSTPGTCQMDFAGWVDTGVRFTGWEINRCTWKWILQLSVGFQILWLPSSAIPEPPDFWKVSDSGNSYSIDSSGLTVLCELHHRITCYGCELAGVMSTSIMEQSNAN